MIEVLRSGIHATIQDKGRFGYAKYGVPCSGAMDSYSADLANLLLQNSKHAVLIENTFGGLQLMFHTPTYICITGGHFSPKLNTFPLEMNHVYEVNAGDVLSFGKRLYGTRSYIGVQGGIQSEKVLGSCSFFNGITSHSTLHKGMVLPIAPVQARASNALSKIKVLEYHYETSDLPCTPGPEYSLLNATQKQQLQESFTLSDAYNRVGIRLHETVPNQLAEMLTSGVLPGTVQLTPSGKLIVLMRDAQVTGGYPRVLQLSEHAIAMLSQKVSGQSIRFVGY